MAEALRLCVIIPTCNRREQLLACLASLHALDEPPHEIVVVDNGSTDDSVAAVRAAYPEVRIIPTASNTGFTGACNRGLQHASETAMEAVLLLNDDTTVASDCVTHLMAAVTRDPAVGVAGPTIYFADAPQRVWSAGGRIDWARGVAAMIGYGEEDHGQFGTEPRPMEWMTGCCLLIRMPVIHAVGSLDPRFFAYYEDAEWCVRVARAGFTIVHVPRARLWHAVPAAGAPPSPRVHYYSTRNRLLFLRLTRAGWRAWWHTLVADYLRTVARWTLRRRWRTHRALRRTTAHAIVDYYAGRFGSAAKYER